MCDEGTLLNALSNRENLKRVQQRLMNETERRRCLFVEMKRNVYYAFYVSLINGYADNQLVISLVYIIMSYYIDYKFPVSLKSNIVDIFTKTEDICVIVCALSKLWNYTQHQTMIYKKLMKEEKNVARMQHYYPLFMSYGIVTVNVLNMVKYLDGENKAYYDVAIKKLCELIQIEQGNSSMWQLYNYIHYNILKIDTDDETSISDVQVENNRLAIMLIDDKILVKENDILYTEINKLQLSKNKNDAQENTSVNANMYARKLQELDRQRKWCNEIEKLCEELMPAARIAEREAADVILELRGQLIQADMILREKKQVVDNLKQEMKHILMQKNLVDIRIRLRSAGSKKIGCSVENGQKDK